VAKDLLSARGLEVAVKAATAEADEKNTRVKIRDGENLMLIVRPGGGASWVLQYRLAGKRLPLTLGAWPTVGLKLARELAAAAREKVARGVDPLKERAAVQAARVATAKHAGDTVRQLASDWLAKQRISEVYRGNIEAAFKKDVLPVIGTMHPAKVVRKDIIDILRTMEKRGALEMLRRVRMWLKQMYEFAMDDEGRDIQASPVPTGHLKSFMPAQKGHFPAITDAGAVAPLMRAIRGYPKPVVRNALLLSAHVWQRPTELREVDQSELDLDGGKWVIGGERMKMDREHWVPLSRQALAIIKNQQGIVGGVGWLFPGQKDGKALSEGTLGGALETLGFKGLHTPHGFRAMARTILEEHLGFDPKLMEKQLAHQEPDKVKRAYNRAEFWEQRVKMMQAWSDWLDAQR